MSDFGSLTGGIFLDKNTERKIDVVNQRIKELNSVRHIAANRLGISDGEICVWSALLRAEEQYSQQELCELLSLPKQTVNSIICNLVKRGYVFLERVPGTRNRKTIRLSEDGLFYGKEKIMWIFEAEQNALAQTEPKQVQICIEMIEKYILLLKKELDID